MATRAKFVRLAQYSPNFFKKGLWQMSASLASPRKSGLQMLASLVSPSKTACECGQVWRVLAKVVGECRLVWRVSHISKKAILANASTHQIC